MTRVVLHARDLLDHPRHSGQRPEVCSKAPRRGPFAQTLIQDLKIGPLQPRLTTRSPRPPQTGRALPPPSRIPAMNTGPAHPKPTSDLRLLQPPSGKQPRCLLAPRTQTLEIPAGTEKLLHEARLFLHPATEGPKRHSIMRDSIAADFADRFKKKLAVTLRRRVFLVAPSFDFHSTVCVCYLGEQLLGGKVEYGLIRAWREGEGFTITHQKCPSIRPSQELQLHEFAVTPGRRLYCVLEPGSKAVVWYIGKRSEKGLRLANGRALTRKTLQVVSRALMPEGPAKEVDVSQSGTLWQHRKKPATRARLVGQLLTGQSGRRRVAVIARFQVPENVLERLRRSLAQDRDRDARLATHRSGSTAIVVALGFGLSATLGALAAATTNIVDDQSGGVRPRWLLGRSHHGARLLGMTPAR